MKKRRWLKIGLAVLAVLALLLIVTQRDRGPEVGGRPLEEWVQDLLVTAAPDRRAAAHAAVAKLGTNALPWLQLAVRHTDTVWKQPLLGAVKKVPGIDRRDLLRWVNLYERSEIRAGGVAGLAALGQAAVPAIPDLVTALGDSEQLVHNNALAALRRLGSLSLSEMTNRLGQSEGGYRTRMLHVLRNMKSDAVAAAPALVKIIEAKPGSDEANAAVAALSAMGHRAAPAVMRLVASERYELRVVGFDALSAAHACRARLVGGTARDVPTRRRTGGADPCRAAGCMGRAGRGHPDALGGGASWHGEIPRGGNFFDG